jgi:hypothetical protein
MPILSILGDFEELFADHLYPYRLVIAPLIVAAAFASAYVLVRRRVHLGLWRHRLATAAVGVPLLAISIVAGNYFLSPLWERNSLNEASPLASADLGSGADAIGEEAAMPGKGPSVSRRGMFMGADDFHFGRGDALVITVDGDNNVLRFENFSVRNGPDLYVYLSRDASGTRVEESLNLGRLKATDGAFNYEIPAAINLADVKSVVVWCRQFAVQFAVAALM